MLSYNKFSHGRLSYMKSSYKKFSHGRLSYLKSSHGRLSYRSWGIDAVAAEWTPEYFRTVSRT